MREVPTAVRRSIRRMSPLVPLGMTGRARQTIITGVGIRKKSTGRSVGSTRNHQLILALVIFAFLEGEVERWDGAGGY